MILYHKNATFISYLYYHVNFLSESEFVIRQTEGLVIKPITVDVHAVHSKYMTAGRISDSVSDLKHSLVC